VQVLLLAALVESLASLAVNQQRKVVWVIENPLPHRLLFPKTTFLHSIIRLPATVNLGVPKQRIFLVPSLLPLGTVTQAG
jgi:hypothetical protein